MPDPFELAAALLGIASVWLASREHVASWPLGLLNVAAYAVIFFHARLFANAGLQVAYLALNTLGWWRWRRGGGAALAVTRTPIRDIPWLAVAGLALAAALYGPLARAGGAAPALDAALTAASLVAQWQLTRKRADTWAWWIVINVGYLVLLSTQGLWPSVGQYAVFLAIAVDGHRRWWRDTRGPVAS
jgi:nicotinamide mononucleotide transporter